MDGLSGNHNALGHLGAMLGSPVAGVLWVGQPRCAVRPFRFMGDFDIDSVPNSDGANRPSGGERPDRQEWIRANFTQIFGVSVETLAAQGIDPRRYARDHRDEIRQFAQMQRQQGIAVPTGRAQRDARAASAGPGGGGPPNRGYGYGGRFGMGTRGGSAWIGVLITLLAVRFLLVDSFAGAHAAIFWVLGIGGIMLVARVLLFSWLRRRRFNRRQPGRNDRSRF
jgi:hypothetical protein